MCPPQNPRTPARPRNARSGNRWLGTPDPEPEGPRTPSWEPRTWPKEFDPNRRRREGGPQFSALRLALPLVMFLCPSRDRFDPASPIGPMDSGGPASGYGPGLWPQFGRAVARLTARVGFGNGPFNLADHAPDCRYRRTMRRLTLGLTP